MNGTSSMRHRIVLLGVGHTNAHVLRMWGMGHAVDDTELVCVSNFPVATYSGMLPAVVAGDVPADLMEIDLLRLSQKCRARLVIAEVLGIDRTQRQLTFLDRPPLAYDALSIGIGSVPTFEGTTVLDGSSVVTIKPMQTFLARLAQAFRRLSPQTRAPRVAIVGGGTASLEIALCLAARFKNRQHPRQTSATELDVALREFDEMPVSIHTSAVTMDANLCASAAAKLNRALEDAHIQAYTHHRVNQIETGTLHFENADTFPADLVIWATSATASELLKSLELEHDERGFLLTRSTLQTTWDDHIFAVGDSGTMVDTRVAKAGVYAVRQGPFLVKNLENLLRKRPLVNYLPQSGFLKLINLGNQTAVAEYRGLSYRGHAAWKLKQSIDTHFMEMYQDYKLTNMNPTAVSDPAALMRCTGCGGKVAAEALADILASVRESQAANPAVILGLDHYDDAAIIHVPEQQITVTTDYFAAPVDDPYLFGRAIVNHAASDLFAMGAVPTAAMANVEIPIGHPRGQNRTFRELMDGCLFELKRINCSLVGGHTIEGPRLAAGLTLFGRQLVPPTVKGDLQPGQQLILTKPLGIGIYLAAWMQAQLPAHALADLQRSLTLGNDLGPSLASQFGIRAMTDVTGFGLVGHLREMLSPQQLSAHLWLDSLPVLPAVAKLLDAKIESTLAPSNQQSALNFGLQGNRTHWKVKTLFDPQTCGGLLLACESQKTEKILETLREHHYDESAVIGEVVSSEESRPKITLV